MKALNFSQCQEIRFGYFAVLLNTIGPEVDVQHSRAIFDSIKSYTGSVHERKLAHKFFTLHEDIFGVIESRVASMIYAYVINAKLTFGWALNAAF